MSRARTQQSFQTVRSEGGLLPIDILQRIAAQDKDLPGLTPDAYHLPPGGRFGEAISSAWIRVLASWHNFQDALARLPENDPATTLTREKFLLPLFEELKFGRLPKKTNSFEVDGRNYAISHEYHRSPIHMLGCRVSLEDRVAGLAGAAKSSPHGLVQDLLNRSEQHLWGFLTNGLLLRILRDHHSLTQQAYVEFDLQAMLDGEHYSDFVLLWLLCHQSRIEAERPEECWLERWMQAARDEGISALDKLRDGVEQAIAALGTGFLKHPRNSALKADLHSGDLDKQEYFRELRNLVYRCIFLFVAEDRGVLLDPDASTEARARYDRYYSTRKLRTLSDRRRGGPHGDLWQGLRLVMDKLYEGCPELGLPALGSFLWSPNAVPNLRRAECANEFLLAAARALCFFTRGNLRFLVNWRQVGADELGSIFESLLELHPRLNQEAGTFELDTAAGHERKTTGSYYTPSSLVDCLLDSALDPVVDAAVAKKSREEAERALLNLKVCDPACGSGHFLVAAARRIAKRLAAVRTGDDEPSPTALQHALRDVVGHCIFGVDRTLMAVELCKVALWMEAIEPGRPLSFLDNHIQHGNSLLGTTPLLLQKGIPDEAFEPIEGDDKEVAKRLKKRNRDFRKEGQTSLEALMTPPPVVNEQLTAGALAVEEDPDDALPAIRKKESDWQRFTSSQAYQDAQLLCDLWCAAFVWPKQVGDLESNAPTQELWFRTVRNPQSIPAFTKREVGNIARQYHFFHWHLAFPHVFETGGFDVMLGNPPWDTLSPDAKEFFSTYEPGIRVQSKPEQEATIARLLRDSAISAAWDANRRTLFATAFFLKESGRYSLFAPGNLGKGDFNVYRSFVELALRLVRDSGWAAQIVPDGFYAGANSMALRRELFEHFTLPLLLGFENTKEVWFKGVHSAAKFALYAARRGARTVSFRAAFCIRSLDELRSVLSSGGLNLPVALIREFSPDALAVMEFRDQRDLDVARKMYSRWPPLGKEIPGTPYREFLRELESGHVQEVLTEDRANLPHYEGRMIAQYDHRAKGYRSGRARAALWVDLPFGSAEKSIQPQWYVARESIPSQARSRIDKYRVGFCDVASPTNERTLVATVLPPACIAGDKVPTVLMRSDNASADLLVWLAVANSFAMDFLVRMKVSLKMALIILDSLPFPRLVRGDPRAHRIIASVLRLVCTGPEMNNLWNMMAEKGYAPPLEEGNVVPGSLGSDERLRLIAAIEAEVAMLFGLSRDEVAYILDTFPIVRKRDEKCYGDYRTKRLILEAYDVVATAEFGGQPHQTLLDPPPADPRVAHPAREPKN